MSLTAHTSDANVLSATYGDECSITMSFKGSIDRRPTTLTCTLTGAHSSIPTIRVLPGCMRMNCKF